MWYAKNEKENTDARQNTIAQQTSSKTQEIFQEGLEEKGHICGVS